MKQRLARRAGVPAGSMHAGLDLGNLDPGGSASPEAQAVRAADRIASTMGDLDDALRSGDLPAEEAEKLPIVRELIRHLGDRYPGGDRRRSFMKANAIHRGLTHLLVTGTIHQSRKALRAWCRSEGVESHDAYLTARRALPSRVVGMAPRSFRLFEGLRSSLDARLSSSSASAASSRRALAVLGSLFETYRLDPLLIDDYVLIRFREIEGGAYLRDVARRSVESEVARRYHGSGVFHRLIVDHIAGMTDAYANSEHDRLAGIAPPPEGSLSPA
jgi:dGTPase